MARTDYFAPGVYVEEIPSAQQPIAGVGTNTAAFIGIVPDQIQYPVPNDKYDPQLARMAVAGPDANKAEIQNLESSIKDLESDKEKTLTAIKQIDDQLGNAALSNSKKNSLENQKKTKNENLDGINAKIKEIQDQINALKKPTTPDADSIKPCVLETFNVDVEPGVAKLCTNFTEYTNRFGPFSADDPEGQPGDAIAPGHRALTHAVYGFFRNGGTRCFVARLKKGNAAEIDRALLAFESIDAIALIAAPGLEGPGVWGQLVAHCEQSKDRFAVLDGQADVESDGELDVNLLNYDGENVLPQRNKNAAFYFPYIEVIDPAKQMQDQDPGRKLPTKYWGRVHVPPSGHIIGIYAKTDEERGVHKAPANCAVLGAINVKYYIGKPKQEILNPQGVNCIRNMNGNIVVWGARTIGGDKNGEWKYVNVRRVFLYLRESIDEGTQWVVFEPNDRALWGKINRNVTAFLTNVWRSGALFGSTPQEAFYVKCDDETNPPELRDLGQVVTEIGVSIVRPAEFVIFRISQTVGENRS